MISRIFRRVISLSLKNSSYLYKSPVSSSVSLLFFSSARPKIPKGAAIALADYLINKHQFSPEALKASSAFTYLKNPDKLDSVLSYLKECGFSKSHLEKLVKKVPRLLFSNLDNTIKPKIKIFQDSGFSPTDIADILSADPWILNRSTARLEPSILVLTSVLGSNASVSKVLKLYGGFLKYDLDKTMRPSIDFMKSCGISSSQIMKYLFLFPRFFLNKPENIMNFVKKVDEMGFDRQSKMFLPAIRTVGSMTKGNWELKVKLFRSLGFSEDDILFVFRRAPLVFAASKKKIKEIIEILLSTDTLDIPYVVNNPVLLMYSVERRLKPRLEVLEILRSKNLLRKSTSLATICKMPNKEFLEKYVIPYSDELGELSMACDGSANSH